jgi:hypothetical protein
MSDIIDFEAKKKAKEAEVAYYTAKDAHNECLDLCEHHFPEGVMLVAIVGGELELSTTIPDHETAFAALYAAAKTVQRKIDEDK